MSASYTAVIGGKLKLKRPVSTVTAAKSGLSSTKPASQSDAASSRSASTTSTTSSTTAAAQAHAAGTQRYGSDSEQSAAAESSSEEVRDDSGRSSGGDKRQKTESTTQVVKDSRTKAERDFEEAQAKREAELIRKKISKSHRQAIDEYNARLAALTEHNDIPRVGPG